MSVNWPKGTGLTPEQAAYRKGLRTAAKFIEEAGWDKQLAIATNGHRVSDIILCKFNMTTLKKPRKIKNVRRPPRVKAKDTVEQRLAEIKRILEHIDIRCLAADGPVTNTRQEMSDTELRRIYQLAKGRKK